MRVFLLVVAAAVCFTAFGALEAEAQTYMVRKRNGTVYFTNTYPANPGDRVIKRITRGKSVRLYSYRANSFPATYDHHIVMAAQMYDLDPLLIKSVIKVESDFNRYTISRKGARGLMQLMPQTAEMMEVTNSFNAAENIRGGARYLRQMIDRFGAVRLALAAYNAGPTAVDNYGGVPPYTETRNYIRKVTAAYKALTGSPVIGSGRVGKKQKIARNKQVVYYTYTDELGRTIVTDKPKGQKSVID